jgi:hypothetical protein
MKTNYQSLKEKAETLKNNELIEAIQELMNEILKSDERLLSVGKSWSGYGTWKSSGWANEPYFGAELAAILTKALSNRVTHDEEQEFQVSDFSERIQDLIYEKISE